MRLHRLATCAVALLVAACGNSMSTSPIPSPPPDVACAAGTPVPGTPALTTRLVASGMQSPLDLQAAPGDFQRLFVVEQGGRIRIIRGGAVSSSAFLNLTGRVSAGSERGLLGLAFHPRFSERRRFYVNYTDTGGDTHIAEFQVSASDPDRADPATERTLLVVQQPFANHNGGGLAFGPDGFLYIGLGDGGSGGDPLGNGQNLSTPLGKILRIDVDSGSPFAIPSDNPFVHQAGAFPANWAYGLRNPWRFSFDRANGDLYIGDVGQGAREEIDVDPSPRHAGRNYGWNITEGNACYPPSSGCNTAGITLPVLDYTHSDGCSVTGGVVYRGCRMPGYAGTYFYGDYCSAFVRSFRFQGGQAAEPRDWTAQLQGSIRAISAFGTDNNGEAYIVDYAGGAVYQIVPAT